VGCVKQVHCPFIFRNGSDIEAQVVDLLIQEGANCKFQPSKRVDARRQQLRQSADIIVQSLHNLLDPYITKHLRRISRILVDPCTTLTWGLTTNNCQNFVNQLLKGPEFETLFPRASTVPDALLPYILSFGNQIMPKDSEMQQKNSFVRAFLNEARRKVDLITFLDLVCDQQPTFEFMHELLLRQTGFDNDETQARWINSLWLFPRDSMSILDSHLYRGPRKYYTAAGKALSSNDWILNRLRLLRQVDVFYSLVGAAGASVGSVLGNQGSSQEIVPLYAKVVMPHALIYGHIRADETIRIEKLQQGYRYIISNRKIPMWLPHKSQNPLQRLCAWLHNSTEPGHNTSEKNTHGSVRRRLAAYLASGPSSTSTISNFITKESAEYSKGKYWAGRYGDNIVITLQYHGDA